MNTAAVLDVVVKAQTSKASVELKKFEKTLKQTAKSAKDTDRNFEVANKKVTTFGSSISDTNQRAMLFKNTVGLIKFPAMIAGLGGMAQAAAAASAGVGGLASALAPLSGLLAAYPALIGAFGQAMGVTAVAGLSDVTDAVGGLNEKLDETSDEFKALSPQAQEFARSLQDAKAPLLDIQKTVQRPLFEGLNEGLQAAQKNLPALEEVMQGTAGAMGRLAAEAGRFVGREGFGEDFQAVGGNNAQLLGRLGDAGLHFADALRHVVVVSQPLVDFLGKGLVKLSEWVEAESKAGRESGRMAEFFERTEKVVRQLVNIGGSLGRVFLDIGRAARPLGEDIMKVLVNEAEKLAKWTDANQGKLRQYFEDARGPLAETGKLLKDVVSGFFSLSQTKGLSGFISQIRQELLPAILDMTKSTTKQFGPVLIDTLTQVVKLLTNFMGSNGPLTSFVELIGRAAEALNSLFKAIPELAQAASMALTGFSIFKLMGLTGGGKEGQGFGSRLGGGIKGGLASAGLGIFVGGLVSSIFTSGGIQDTVEGKGATWGTKFGDAFAATARPKIEKAISGFDVDTLQALHKPLKDLQRWFEERGAGGSEALDGLIAHVNRARKRIAEDVIRIGDEIQAFGQTWGQSLEEINHRTDKNMADIERSLGLHSRRGRQAVSDNFFAAMEAIENSMKSGEISAKKGAKAIHEVLVKQLRSYGIKDVAGFLNRQEQASEAHKGGGASGLASGGLAAMVPGSSTGDKHTLSIDGVPKARVESGEGVFVGNRKMMGAAAAANAAVPRFQAGGGLQPGIQSLVTWAGRNLGLNVSSGLRPGDSDSFHGSGEAADLVPPSMGATRRIFGAYKDQLAELFYDPWGGWNDGQMIGAIGDHMDHIHAAIRGAGGGMAAAVKKLKLPRFSSDFGLGSLVATGLNNVATGTESVLDKRLAAQVMTSHHVGAGALSKAEFMSVARQAIKLTGADGFNVAGLLTLAMQESGLDPGSQNLWDSNAAAGDPSGGLMQLTGSNFSTYHQKGTANDIFDPLANIAASINYQLARYGGQVTHSPYMRGGLLAMLAEGGEVSIPELFPHLGSDDQDRRKNTLDRILGKIADFGIKDWWADPLYAGTKALENYQEYAGIAGQGDTTDANDNLIPGIFSREGIDGTQHAWLLKARQEAWTLRKNLITAKDAMPEQIDQFEGKKGLIEKAKDRLEQVRKALHDAQVHLKKLLDQIEIQKDKIEHQKEIIEDAKEQLDKKGLSDAQRHHQQDRIDDAQKKIETAQGVIANITDNRIPGVENDIQRATRERDTLVDPITTALADKYADLIAIREGITNDGWTDDVTGKSFDSLKTIQGAGSSMDPNMEMPDNLHQIFGGTLNDIQQELLAMIPEAKPGDTVIDQLESALAVAGLTADLSDDIAAQSQIVSYWEEELARLQESGGSASDIGNAANSLKSARDALASLQETTAPEAVGAGEAGEADTLRLDLLMAENARLRMSAQQAGTFAGFFRQFSAMPQFATGGVMDRTGPALIHGREGIFTPEQMAALGGRGDVNVNVNLDGMDVVVETWIDGVLAKETRKALSRGPTVGRRTS